MLTLLSPWALFGAALLAIPVAIHLFKPKRVRQMPFPSLRWLRESQQKLSRRIQWHQILLFLMRAALILLLVLALARPMFSPGGGGRLAEQFIVLDVSRSMGYQAAGRLSPLDWAKQIADGMLTAKVPGDRATVLLTASSTQALGPLTTEAEIYIPALRAAVATAADTNLASALEVIGPMLTQVRPGAQAHLYFLTDNCQRSWDPGQIQLFLKHIRVPLQVHVIDVGVQGAQNGWIASARVVDGGPAGRRAIRVQAGCLGETQTRKLRLTNLPGMAAQERNLTLEPGRLVAAEFDIPPGFDMADKVGRLALEPGDDLPSDDVFFVNLDTGGAMRVLIVEAESTQIVEQRPSYYLSVALEALSSQAGGILDTQVKTPASLAARDMAEADVVFLANVPELSEPNVQALETRVRAGGGAAIFLGPEVQSDFYNRRLFNPLAPSESLLPAPLGKIVEADPGQGALPLPTQVRWNHPLLAPLFDPVLGDLMQTRFKSWYELDVAALKGNQPLAWIGQSAPALVEHALGAGKVILLNTTAGDSWSDLPRRRSFVPLVDRLLARLSGGGLRREFEVGEPVALPLPGLQQGQALSVLDPQGQSITPALRQTQGRAVLVLDGLTQPGVYRVKREEAGKADFAFVVHAGRADSVLTPTDPLTLEQWWAPAPLEVMRADEAGKSLTTASTRVGLWPWLLLAACLTFMAEMYYVHYFCPKTNPGVTRSLVQGRRILASKSA